MTASWENTLPHREGSGKLGGTLGKLWGKAKEKSSHIGKGIADSMERLAIKQQFDQVRFFILKLIF